MTTIDKPVRRLTRGALDYSHGPDRGRKLVVAFEVGDLVTIRPQGRRSQRVETVSLFDIYRYAITRRVNAGRMQKLRDHKAKLEERRIRAKLTRSVGGRPIPIAAHSST